MDAELKEKLEALLAQVRRRDEIPHREVYSKTEARCLLGGISARTLDRMIAVGELFPCRLGMKEKGGIPRVEIERIATPQAASARDPRASGARRGPKPKAERAAPDEAAAIRALTKRR